MGRTWFGWDRTASDEVLWTVNRGRWRLDERALKRERFATLSYRGIVQVVAELTGFEAVSADPKPGLKKALLGRVLTPGDPVRDGLVGRPVGRQRNPVSYIDTSDVDTMSTAERARSHPERGDLAFLVTNNPDLWAWDEDEYDEDVQLTAEGGIVRGQWSVGSRTGGVEPGDRVFMLRQGRGRRGIVGSGTFTSRVFQDAHWDGAKSQDANYALIDWDALVDPEDVLPIERLKLELSDQHWEPQASGTSIRPAVRGRLEQIWAEHLGRPASRRTAPRAPWQLDPERRKQVEDAAQDRLMRHYRDLGWQVQDTRHGNPYDAIAVKGAEVKYLEAKGTETVGRAVIVTRGEIDHARTHPGQCVLGVLSDIEFTAAGELVPNSGTFRMFDWSPADADLIARSYDYILNGKPLTG
jgi:hypothetical protein